MDESKDFMNQLPSHSDKVARATILIGTILNGLDLSELEALATLAETMKMFVDYTSLKCLVFHKDEETISNIVDDLFSSIEEDE